LRDQTGSSSGGFLNGLTTNRLCPQPRRRVRFHKSFMKASFQWLPCPESCREQPFPPAIRRGWPETASWDVSHQPGPSNARIGCHFRRGRYFNAYGAGGIWSWIIVAPRTQPPPASCCVMQCSAPNPQISSVQLIPTTSRSGNTRASVPSATRSLGSLNVGVSTSLLAI